MAALLKSAESQDSVGSNPTLSARTDSALMRAGRPPSRHQEFAMHFDCPHVAEIAHDASAEGGFPLGTWVTTYRERGREGALEDDERAALEAIPGWSW